MKKFLAELGFSDTFLKLNFSFENIKFLIRADTEGGIGKGREGKRKKEGKKVQ